MMECVITLFELSVTIECVWNLDGFHFLFEKKNFYFVTFRPPLPTDETGRDDTGPTIRRRPQFSAVGVAGVDYQLSLSTRSIGGK